MGPDLDTDFIDPRAEEWEFTVEASDLLPYCEEVAGLGPFEFEDCEFLALLRAESSDPHGLRLAALRLALGISECDMTGLPYGEESDAMRLIRLAQEPIEDGMNHLRYSRLRDRLLPELRALTGAAFKINPIEHTMLLAGMHLLHACPFEAFRVAWGMVRVRRELIGCKVLDDGSWGADRTVLRNLGVRLRL